MDAERVTATIAIGAIVSIPFVIFCVICHFANQAPRPPQEREKYRDDLFV